MKRLVFKKFDAFTDGSSSGNPAACIYLNSPDELSKPEMQKIAFEMKGFVNEVAFLLRDDRADFYFQYFSSECEVDFCGHATVAVMADIAGNDPLYSDRKKITVRVKDKILPIENDIKHGGSVFIEAQDPVFYKEILKKNEISKILNAKLSRSYYPPGLINAGLKTLIMPVNSMENILSISPDIHILKDFCLKNEIDIILVFTEDTFIKDREYRTRVFAPKYGYLEDPATGSGSAAFGHYLLRHGFWDGSKIFLEQGPVMEKPNTVILKTRTEKQGGKVLFGGTSIVRIEGEYILE